MAETYFARRPRARRRPASFEVMIRGQTFLFHTAGGVFSRKGLDRGTELLLEALEIGPCESLLDLGCGYGAVGIVAARLAEGGHVILTDVNARAVALARRNLRSNGIANAEVRRGDLYGPVVGLKFDHVLSNPPIRAGRRVVDRIIDEVPTYLHAGGHLWLVARTKQGADAIRMQMTEVFGNAVVVRRGSGYKVLRSTMGPKDA